MDCQKIDCQKVREYLYPFIDGELNEQNIREVKEHISKCPLCRMEIKNEEEVDGIFKSCFPKELASYDMKENLLSKVREKAKSNKMIFMPYLKPIAAAFMLVVLLSYFLIYLRQPFPLVHAAVDRHIKVLQGKIQPAVISSNPEEVYSMLQGKLDFKVHVPDFTAHDAKLKSGCVCDFKKKNAAHIVYDKAGHKISAFMFVSEGMKMPKGRKVTLNKQDFYIESSKGYNCIFWDDNGMGCLIMSDLDEAELLYLVKGLST